MIVLSVLPRLAWSRNPLPVTITSNDYLVTAGVKSINTLAFSGAISAGNTILFTWAAKSILFTAATTPDSSGEQFPSGAGNTAYVTSLVDIFRGIYYIEQNYQVSSSGTNLVFTARKVGVDFNMIAVTSGNMTLSVTAAGINQQLRPNFANLLEIWRTGSPNVSLWSRTLNLDYPYTGASNKNVAEIIDSSLDYDVPNMTAIWQACPLSVINCYLRAAEFYGDSPVVKKTVKSSTIVFCLGGYSNKALGVITDGINHLQKYLLPDPSLFEFQRWFESFPVNNFDVKTNQPAFLYFMSMRDVAETLAITITVTFTDGATTTVTKAGGLLQPLNKVCVAVGYLQLGLDAVAIAAGKDIAGYQVKLTEATSHDTRSLVKSFTINRGYEEYTRYFLYSDSAGNFKILRTCGKSKLMADVTASAAIRFDSQQTPVTGNTTRYDIYMEEKDEVNSGFLQGDQSLDQLAEMVLAEKTFRVFGNSLVPITITNSSFEFEADGVNLKAGKIEYSLAYQERLYTGSTGALLVPRLNQSQQTLNDI